MAVLVWLALLSLGVAAHAPAYAETTRVLFEDDELRIVRVRVPVGERIEMADHRDALLVPLTADLEGRRPPADVAWQPAGTTVFENRAATTYDAVVVELLAPAGEVPAPLPPEALPERIHRYVPEYRAAGHRVRTVFDHPRVLVTRHRLPAWQPRLERLHDHPRGVVLVYLTGGEMAGSTGRVSARRVRRGEIDVLPAHVWHAFRNAGNDPIEFLMVTPR